MDAIDVGAKTKLTEGFALADRMVDAVQGGPEANIVADMIDAAGNDSDLAVVVIARLLGYLDGRSNEEREAAARRAGIPPALNTLTRVTPAGLVLP